PLRQTPQAESKKITPRPIAMSLTLMFLSILSVISVMTELHAQKNRASSPHAHQLRDLLAHLAQLHHRGRRDRARLFIPSRNQLEERAHVAQPLAHVGVRFAALFG